MRRLGVNVASDVSMSIATAGEHKLGVGIVVNRRAGNGKSVGSVCRLGAGLLSATALLLANCTIPPKPMTNAERATEAAKDLSSTYANQEPLHGPLTLNEAFARALKYNLDARVKMMQEMLAQDDLDLSRLDMLPTVLASAGYRTRDQVDASSSTSIITGRQSLEPSTSSDLNRRTADLTLSWNILDFGVSYFAARQAGNRQLIAQEERRKVVQQMIQDVRRSFWRAASAQRLSGRVREAVRAAEAALPAARKVESEALRSPVDSLRYQKLLLDLLRQLEVIERDLSSAKTELAALINLPPGQRFTIAVPSTAHLGVGSAPMHVRDMEEVALILNPDVRSMSYQGRISIDESRKQLLKLLPGISATYNPNYDSNSFLTHNYWTAGTVLVSGYLNNLLKAPYRIRQAENGEVLADEQRKAVSVAVLAKLHIAYDEYLATAREYRWANELAGVDDRLYQQIANRAAGDTGVQSALERVSAQVSAVTSDLRRYQSYADAQAALGRLYDTMGLDPASASETTLSVKALSRVVGHTIRNWRKVRPKSLVTAQDDTPAK
jgi:outer membrane protein TolC